MPDDLLPQLLAAYAEPALLTELLSTSHTGLCEILAHIRDTILDWLDIGDTTTVERAVLCAWALARQSDHPEAQALAHWCNGLALLNRETVPALQHLDAAYAFYHAGNRRPEEGRLLIGRAGLLGQLGRLEEAEQAIITAAAYLADAPAYQNRMSALLITRSDIEGRLGRYEAMQATAREAEALAIQYEQPAARAEALINQAFAALFLGMFHHAEAALEQAFVVAQQSTSPELCGRVAVNQARLAIYRGELFAALRLLEQARSDFAKAQIAIDQATVAIEEASLYERLQLPREARRVALQAATMFDQAGLVQESAEALLQAARIALVLDQPALARHDLDRARSLASLPPTLYALLAGYAAHPRIQPTPTARRTALQQASEAMTALATAGVLSERLEVALIEAALYAALHQPEAVARYQSIVDSAHTHGLSGLEQRALVGMATMLRPKAACAPLQQAVDLSAQARRIMPVEELKASYLSGMAPLYARLMTTYLKTGKPDQALHTLLEARGSLWAELAAPSAQPDHVPLLHDQAWLCAKTELYYWQQQSYLEYDPAYQVLCKARIRQAEDSLVTLARRQTRQRPAYPLPGLAEIRHALPAEALVVEYMIDSDRIYACLLTPDAPPRWVTVGALAPVVECLGKLTLLYGALRSCPTPAEQQRRATAQLPLPYELLAELYMLLISPLTAEAASLAPYLAIVPDGLLFGVPWAALRDRAGADGHYLAERHELVILPSAVLPALPQPAAVAGPPLALGYAGQPPLRHVPAELTAIKRQLPEVRCVNPADSEALGWTTPPIVLHFAMHAQVNYESPLLSHLLMADGALLLADVLSLSLHGTALVTLSACDTGITPERGGVALAMAGAFLTAGARAVIASLWPVDDEATALMMENLYAALAAGHTIPQALRQAQAQLRVAGYTHPYYWAAFQPLLRSWHNGLRPISADAP